MKKSSLLPLLIICAACSTPSKEASVKPDPYLHLEAVRDAQAIKWVQAQNEKSWGELSTQSNYASLEKEIRLIVTDKERIPYALMIDGRFWNFWQDAEHPRGILRETSPAEYVKAKPKWRTVLDIDALNKQEGKSWVYRGAKRPEPEHSIGLIALSDGGSDRSEIREFDFKKNQFVKDGFFLPVNKHRYDWVDRDTLLVASDFGPGTLTTSGYPRQVKLWKRGTDLKDSKLLFEGKHDDMMVLGWRNPRPEGDTLLIQRVINFYESETFLYDRTRDMLSKVAFPDSAEFMGAFQGQLIAKLRKPWKNFSEGSLVSLPIDLAKSEPELVWAPDERSTFNNIQSSKSFLLLSTLSNVRSRVLKISRVDNKWHEQLVNVADGGEVEFIDVDNFRDTVLVSTQSFLNPPTLYLLDLSSDRAQVSRLKGLPHQFVSSGAEVTQKEVVSRDGTRVPYFLVHQKGLKLDGKNPTLLYGYGGFENSMTPSYRGAMGKAWLEKGGVYALANIRGGGEFGPKWHAAALKENRQKAYDDFIAISEDLIKSGVTSPRHLGIHGGSNGGLLVGVAFTQRPDLYNAVICEAALLDMLRYHKLPPGASWIAEYGDPEIPAEAAYISKYSPYQNVKSGVKYPKVFFYTSTGDDRVQPGHTRKMVALMQQQGSEVLLYENIEGGHGGAADLEQQIKRAAMQYAYLWKQLK